MDSRGSGSNYPELNVGFPWPLSAGNSTPRLACCTLTRGHLSLNAEVVLIRSLCL